MSSPEADALKAKGNEAFKAQKWDEAIRCFSDAIAIAPTNHVLYSNRSAAFASKGEYESALADAEKTVKVKADWPKGYGRKGAALVGLGQLFAAKEAYEEGLKLDAANAQLKSGLAEVQATIDSAPGGGGDPMASIASKFSDPAILAKLATDPSTAAFMKQPDFLAKLEMIKTNPSTFSLHMQDQRFMAALGVVLGINIQSGPPPSGANPADMQVEDDDAPPAAAAAKAPAPAKAAAAPELSDDQSKSLQEKELGTAAYKKKEFETAIKHYTAATELDPTNMVFHLNIGAVYLQTKDFSKCIEACEKAREVGRENQAPFKMMAKADARIAKAYALSSDMDKAIEWYDRALTNHRCREYIDAKKKLEKKNKEQKRLAYIDLDKSIEHKTAGNDFFKAGDYPAAIKEYTEAIARNPDDGKLFSNRAASYTKLAELPHALKDCNECIRLAPDFIKGYLRKGNVLLAMKKPSEALSAFQKAEVIDANHPEVKTGLRDCYKIMHSGDMSQEERAQAAMQDPEIQAILRDPVMQSILSSLSSDPGALRNHMNNPEIAAKIQKLINAGVLGTK